jgi:hypothetical protein
LSIGIVPQKLGIRLAALEQQNAGSAAHYYRNENPLDCVSPTADLRFIVAVEAAAVSAVVVVVALEALPSVFPPIYVVALLRRCGVGLRKNG